MSRAIVVGVDGSPGARTAPLDPAIELAQALGDALVVAHAASRRFAASATSGARASGRSRSWAAALTAKAVERRPRPGSRPRPSSSRCVPRKALLHLATERDARLIVVGTASARPLTGLILGSVPHKLLHRSSVPVLVVPVPDDEYQRAAAGPVQAGSRRSTIASRPAARMT